MSASDTAPHVVPRGCVERQGYVPMGRITLGDPGRIDPAAVTEKYRELIHLTYTGAQPSPPPVGRWLDDGTFEIIDGRHHWLALVMLGYRTFLVRWQETTDA